MSAISSLPPHTSLTSVRRSPARIFVVLLAAFALSISLVAVAAPAGATTTRRTATELSFSRAVMRVLNAERRAHHLRPLRYDARLRLSARRHNLAMARKNVMSHQVRGEADFARRIDQAGYHWSWAGENIAWNSVMNLRGVVALEKLMYAERAPENGHRLNILSRHYRNYGVDVYVDWAHHKVWLTTDFGHL